MNKVAQNFKKAGKVALASVLMSATVLTAVGCDELSLFPTSAQTETEIVYETDANGEYVTDQNGEFVTSIIEVPKDSVSSEENTETEAETIHLDTLTLEEQGLNYVFNLSIEDAINGMYTSAFNTVYDDYANRYNTDEDYKYFADLHNRFDSQTREKKVNTMQALKDSLEQGSKDLSFTFNVPGVKGAEISFVLNTANDTVAVLTIQDGKEAFAGGVVNGEVIHGSSFITTTEDAQMLQANINQFGTDQFINEVLAWWYVKANPAQTDGTPKSEENETIMRYAQDNNFDSSDCNFRKPGHGFIYFTFSEVNGETVLTGTGIKAGGNGIDIKSGHPILTGTVEYGKEFSPVIQQFFETEASAE